MNVKKKQKEKKGLREEKETTNGGFRVRGLEQVEFITPSSL